MTTDNHLSKLHLGCGQKHLKGWINVDILATSAADVCDDVTQLHSITNESVSEIYACHILEHIKREDVVPTLMLWHMKLVEGGFLKVAVPDFENICHRYSMHKDVEELLGLVVGGLEGKLSEHKIIFDYQFLKKCLKEAGFVNIQKYDWRTTDHAEMDDYSQAYLPHMDKEKGTLMSLNVSAYKGEQ